MASTRPASCGVLAANVPGVGEICGWPEALGRAIVAFAEGRAVCLVDDVYQSRGLKANIKAERLKVIALSLQRIEDSKPELMLVVTDNELGLLIEPSL